MQHNKKAYQTFLFFCCPKKSDKNLRMPENLVYYIQEMRKRSLPGTSDGFAVVIPFFVKKSRRLDIVLAAGFLFL